MVEKNNPTHDLRPQTFRGPYGPSKALVNYDFVYRTRTDS